MMFSFFVVLAVLAVALADHTRHAERLLKARDGLEMKAASGDAVNVITVCCVELCQAPL